MEPGAYIAGEVGRFLGALISLGVLSRLSAFIFSKFNVGLKKRYVISDLLVMCVAVTVSMIFTNNPKSSAIYVIGSMFLLAYDLQKINHWINKVPEISSRTAIRSRLNLGECWQVVKKLHSFDVVRIAVSMALLTSLLVDSSYQYHSLFKGICFATFGASAYAAYLAIQQKKYGWAWALAIIAMTYYPFQSIDDDSPGDTFQIKYKLVANIMASLILILSIRALRKQAPITINNVS